MKLLVCGGRDYEDVDGLYKFLDTTFDTSIVTHIIQGGARGADLFAGKYARDRGIQEVICPANWTREGKSAGFIRNHMMLNLLDKDDDYIVAFPGGNGTAHMVKIAKGRGYRVIVTTS